VRLGFAAPLEALLNPFHESVRSSVISGQDLGCSQLTINLRHSCY
jgi:hypothetical protein